jgi:nucleotide-binding universal stress UspA family protein
VSPGSRCVIVGYDGSAAARAAVEWAARRAAPDGRVVAVHAFGPPPDWLGHPSYQRMLDEHRGRGEALLAELTADRIEALARVELELELIAGDPAEAISRIAETHAADEITVGSRGLGPVRAALGSVSQKLLHLADRPVVVIPERAVDVPAAAHQ